jgi:hypothetical protein
MEVPQAVTFLILAARLAEHRSDELLTAGAVLRA